MTTVNRTRNVKLKPIIKYPTNVNAYPQHTFESKHVLVPIMAPNIFQAWHTLDIPPLMEHAMHKIKYTSPQCNYYLFDEQMCRTFIERHYSQEILHAYDNLPSYTSKIELWKYCVLYKHGGIYIDPKYTILNNFQLIYLLEHEYIVTDNANNIHTGVISCVSGNPMLLKAIHAIVYTLHSYPCPLTCDQDPKYTLMLCKRGTSEHDNYITFHKCFIMRQYPGYTDESYYYL